MCPGGDLGWSWVERGEKGQGGREAGGVQAGGPRDAVGMVWVGDGPGLWGPEKHPEHPEHPNTTQTPPKHHPNTTQTPPPLDFQQKGPLKPKGGHKPCSFLVKALPAFDR